MESISDDCEEYSLFDINFKKSVTGYHYINSTPINETVWEDINSLIFSKSNIEIHSKSDGSHSSGMDIHSSFGRISNKSSKYSSHRKKFSVSSYRLTTVCSEKTCGDITTILDEINRRKNFDYYSILIRDENTVTKMIHYDWLLIKSDYPLLDPSLYIWEPTIGKKGKNKDVQVGWNTNKIEGCSMRITFSMSSQLWIEIEMTEDIKKYIISSISIHNNPVYNYIDIVDKLNI
jgi:hypothetical protein